MDYHPKHLCRHCRQAYEKHAASAVGDVPKDRCPGKEAKWPTSIKDEERAGKVFDERLRRMWTARKTTFAPVL